MGTSKFTKWASLPPIKSHNKPTKKFTTPSIHKTSSLKLSHVQDNNFTNILPVGCCGKSLIMNSYCQFEHLWCLYWYLYRKQTFSKTPSKKIMKSSWYFITSILSKPEIYATKNCNHNKKTQLTWAKHQRFFQRKKFKTKYISINH